MVPGGEVGEARGPSREGRAGEILQKNRAGEEGDWRREAGDRRRLGPLPLPLPPDGDRGKEGGAGGGGREKREGKQIRVRGE